MRREGLLLLVSVAASLGVGLGLVRWLAPGLVGGGPADLRIVQVEDRVVPFFENVFRDQEAEDGEYVLNDPYSIVRLRPFFPPGRVRGPTDLLGFRNRAVPYAADVVVIGDSQTYGTGVPLEDSWPEQLARRLGDLDATVYSMAVGGWGAVQYLDMFRKSRVFRPAVVVVAFYAGNDPRESARAAYAVEHWAFLRPDDALTLDDMPPVPRRGQQWRARLPSGRRIAFTPDARLASQRVDEPMVNAGWAIMAGVAARIVREAEAADARPVFAVIPTKESALAELLRSEGIALHPSYAELVLRERTNVDRLLEAIRRTGAPAVDLLPPLARAGLRSPGVYPASRDGHPLAEGHEVIATSVAPVLRPLLEAHGAERVDPPQ